MYDYKKAMKEDIKEYIEENDLKGVEEEELYDMLWIADSVTGNGSGSYTFDRWKAEEYVKDNLPLAIEACMEFGICAECFGEKIYNENYEWLDVTIRCFLLSEMLSEVLEEL